MNRLFSILTFFIVLQGCAPGGTGTGNPNTSTTTGNVTIQSGALAGPNAASLEKTGSLFASTMTALAEGLGQVFFGIKNAYAAVSSFTSFSACNDTLIFYDQKGEQLTVNGSQNPSVGQGLLTFSPTSTSPMTIGTISIDANTVLSEIDITFAVVPDVCSGAKYAIQFDSGTGAKEITQNTAFKFKFSSGKTITGDSQTLTLLFGTIVNAMVSQGSNLNDSTIQTINVGQAQ